MAKKTVTNRKISFDASTNPDLVVEVGAGASTTDTQQIIIASDSPDVVSLANIDAKTPALSGGGVPVAIISSPDFSIAPASLTATGVLFTQDCAEYASVAVQVTSPGTSCTITYEQSLDNANWLSCTGNFIGASESAPVVSSTIAGIWVFPVTARYFRARVSTYTSGTVTAQAYVRSLMPEFVGGLGANVTVNGSVTVGSVTSWGNVVDNGAFVDGTTRLSPNGYIYDEVAGTALAENDAAAARINANRAQVQAIEDGTTRGRYATVTAAGALSVLPFSAMISKGLSNAINAAGSTTTVLKTIVGVGTAVIGDIVVFDYGTDTIALWGATTYITAFTSSTITVSPALPIAPSTLDIFGLLQPSFITANSNHSINVADTIAETKLTSINNNIVAASQFFSLLDGKVVVATAGTRVQLIPSYTTSGQITITALSSNSGTIVVGGVTCVAAIGTRRGHPLEPGDSWSVTITDPTTLYIDATVNGEGVSYVQVSA